MPKEKSFPGKEKSFAEVLHWELKVQNKLYLYSQDFQQECQKNHFSTYGAETTGFPHAQEAHRAPTSHHAQKLTQNGSRPTCYS